MGKGLEETFRGDGDVPDRDSGYTGVHSPTPSVCALTHGVKLYLTRRGENKLILISD